MQANTRRWVNVGSLAFALLVNGLANVVRLGGNTTGQVSDRFDAMFTPAGYVFAIWSLIYLWLLGYVIYQALPKTAEAPFQRQIGPFFALNMVANALWIVCWHLEWITASLVVMAVILLTLLIIYTRLGTGVRRVKPLVQWLVRAPFSLYLAWISVATIANVSVWLIAQGWQGAGLSEVDWTVIMLLVGTALSMVMSFLRRDWLYGLVFVWAFVGIFVANRGIEGRGLAGIVALVCALLSAAGVVLGFLWGRRPKPAASEEL